MSVFLKHTLKKERTDAIIQLLHVCDDLLMTMFRIHRLHCLITVCKCMQIWVFMMVCEWSLRMKLLVILTIWPRVRIDFKKFKLLSDQQTLRNCTALPNLTFCKACRFTGNDHAQNFCCQEGKNFMTVCPYSWVMWRDLNWIICTVYICK